MDHGGDAHAPVDVLDELEDAAGGGRVQGGGGLVAQQHLGVAGQGPGNGDALLLPAGELHRIGVGLVGQAHDVQILQGALPRLPLGTPAISMGKQMLPRQVRCMSRLNCWKIMLMLRRFSAGPWAGGRLHEILSRR